jgi:hypothetical protein
VRESIEYRVEQVEDGKQANLVSGTNIKTINGSSLLGSGNLVVGGGSFSGDMDDIPDGTTYVKTENNYTDADVAKVAATSGTNTGDQTSIVGISGTKANFDTACSDGNFLYVGDVTQYTDENAQDAVGAMVANSTFVNLAYVDGTPSLTPSLSATGTPSSTTFLRGDNTWATPTDPEGWTVIVKSANQDVTGSSTVADDTDLQFSVVAGGHYMIDANITISGSNQNNDYKFAFNVSSGTMKGNGTVQHLSTTGSVANTLVQASAAASTTEVGCAATGGTDIDSITCIRIAYSFTASANATFKYRFALNSASAGITARTWKGSILKYKRID